MAGTSPAMTDNRWLSSAHHPSRKSAPDHLAGGEIAERDRLAHRLDVVEGAAQIDQRPALGPERDLAHLADEDRMGFGIEGFAQLAVERHHGIFQQRRKTLLNALRPVAATFGLDAVDLIDRADVDPQQRPGDLPLAGFAALARAVL